MLFPYIKGVVIDTSIDNYRLMRHCYQHFQNKVVTPLLTTIFTVYHAIIEIKTVFWKHIL